MHSKPIDASHTANIGQGPYQAKEVKDIIHDSEDDPRERAMYGCSVDIWAIGTVAYEIHAKKVFNELTDDRLRRNKLFNIPERLDASIMDPTVNKYLFHCLHWEPSRRKNCSFLMDHAYLNPHSTRK